MIAGGLIDVCTQVTKTKNKNKKGSLMMKSTVEKLENAIGVFLIILGSVHVFLGILCIKQLKERELEKMKKIKQLALQVKELSQHKDEVEKMIRPQEV